MVLKHDVSEDKWGNPYIQGYADHKGKQKYPTPPPR